MKRLFARENIELSGTVPVSASDLRRPDKLRARGLQPEKLSSAVMFAVPYLVRGEEGNISLYTRAEDYHLFCAELFKRLEPLFEEAFGKTFRGFADDSPLTGEVLLAAKAGIGIIGDNRVLITEKYGSFVFIAELLSDIEPEALGYKGDIKPGGCLRCGKCREACPAVIEGLECLSAVTQKKGALTEAEREYMIKYKSAWGCDICQLVCPLCQGAEETPIAFFKENRTPYLTAAVLEKLDCDAFSRRAYSWRGRAVAERNAALLGEKK